VCTVNVGNQKKSTTIKEQTNCPFWDEVGHILCSFGVERFSFECQKVIGFAFTTPRDWFKKLAPLFHPIRSKTKTNRDSLVRVFPHFALAICNYFVF